MQKKHFFRFLVISLLLASSLILLKSFSSTRSVNNPSCKKSIEKCPEKPTDPGGMIWESLSRQFFTSITP